MKSLLSSKLAKVGAGFAAVGGGALGGYYLLSDGSVITASKITNENNLLKYKSGANERLARKGKPFSGILSADKYDYYKDFNYPGDCVMKLFPGIEKSPIFEFNYSSEEVKTVTEKTIFNNSSQTNGPKFACYTYNDEILEDKFRVELAIRKDKEGWVWMSGFKNDIVKDKKTVEYKDTLWFREFYLTSTDNKNWTVELGQEGETTGHAGHKLEFPANWNLDHYYWGIALDSGEPCVACENKTRIAKSFYWKPENNSKHKLRDLNPNMDRQVTRFSPHTSLIHQGRKMVYQNNVWKPYRPDPSTATQPLIKLENSKAAELKGTWRDLNSLCFDFVREKPEKDAFDVFCK